MIRLVICAIVLPITCLCELITVQTSRGAVQGFDHDFGNDTTQRFFGYGQLFLGIPYAKAPLGAKIHELPEDICQYNEKVEVHNATYYRPRCWQPPDKLQPADKMDENCLYLNVMTPNVSGKYPVMVYIHGGTGGADVYDWKGAVRNLVYHGVVVVTIQYRLGLMGFFTTFTERFPPNRGMYDQILAPRWVNEEITNFGGDSSRVTIFGQSAGATSVSDLSLSPLAKGLFHQLIQTSGSSLMEIETIDDVRGSIHKDRAQQLCGINTTDWGSAEKDEALMNCLVKATPQEIISFDFVRGKNWQVAIDGAFLPDYPEKLAKIRPKYPALIGDVLEEAAFFNDGDLSNITRQTNLDMFRGDWPNYDEETAKNASDIMIDGYSSGTIPADADHMGWAKLTTDINTGRAFSSNMIRDVQWHRKAGNEDLWLFTLTHSSLLPFSAVGGVVDDWIPIAHCSDLPYIWFYADIWEAYNASDADFAVAAYMGGMWTDFSKNG
ncbi:hypothetical protein PMAYCL1PPCAC_08602 [Pristionchus mayeri]|uniref:Carboxylic ester hydrolase n=1 Tax=Pristionchus mayeri TaxID=1317129 RepID=A0AAN4ZC29_9BILA|nr:hypothetical protein PMAYCL1PPCAC_08602 [Pristionchus mayeri]